MDRHPERIQRGRIVFELPQSANCSDQADSPICYNNASEPTDTPACFPLSSRQVDSSTCFAAPVPCLH